jgi:chemotaxis protein CheZ
VKEKFKAALLELLKEQNIAEENLGSLSDKLYLSFVSLISKEITLALSNLASLETIKKELSEIDDVCHNSTEKILSSCKSLTELSSKLADQNNKHDLERLVAEIFTSCGFQDIVNQRMVKTQKLLAGVSLELNDLMTKKLGTIDTDAFSTNEDDNNDPDKKLLNGPQSAAEALTQKDIDKLLKG